MQFESSPSISPFLAVALSLIWLSSLGISGPKLITLRKFITPCAKYNRIVQFHESWKLRSEHNNIKRNDRRHIGLSSPESPGPLKRPIKKSAKRKVRALGFCKGADPKERTSRTLKIFCPKCLNTSNDGCALYFDYSQCRISWHSFAFQTLWVYIFFEQKKFTPKRIEKHHTQCT